MKKIITIETGGKQYRTEIGGVIKIEKLTKENGIDCVVDDKVVFDKVLLIEDGESVEIGKPYLEKKVVTGLVKECGRSKKVTIIKFKNKTNRSTKQGHKQHYCKVLIEGVK